MNLLQSSTHTHARIYTALRFKDVKIIVLENKRKESFFNMTDMYISGI